MSRPADTAAGVNLLLVDDQDANLLALEAVLGDLGHRLVKARSGEEALRALLDTDFAVILLDVRMQGMSGFELARLVRGRERSRHTPIIFLTAYGDDRAFPPEDAYALGAVDYLVKPFVPAALRSKVGVFAELYRKGEQLRQAADRRAEAILESITDGFIALDRDWRFTYANAEAERLNGLPRGEMLGKGHWELFPATVGTAVEREFRRAVAAQVPVEFENHYEPWDRWFLLKAYPAPDGGLSVYFRDVTDRRRAEQALRSAEADMRLVVESVKDYAIFSLDLGGNVASWNAGAERVFGFREGEILGRPGALLFTPEDRAAGKPEEEMGNAVAKGHAEDERWHMRKDGARFFASGMVTPLRDDEGRLRGFTKVARDVTARKRAEERQALLAEAGRILGSSLDYEATLTGVCGLVVPELADWCALDLLESGGQVHRLAVAHKDPAKVEFARELWRRYPPKDDDRGLLHVLRTGEPAFYPEVTDDMLVGGARDPEHLEILRALGLTSVIIVPLTARGRTLGAMTLVTAESSRRFVEEDMRLALDLSSRAALAVDNSRLFSDLGQAARRREEALALHRSVEEQLTLLVEASGSLSVSLDLHAVLTAILDLSRRLVAADAYAVWRFDATTALWTIGHASGLSEDYQRSAIRVLQEAPGMPETPIVAEDVLGAARLGEREAAYEREGIRSLLVVPLKVRGTTSGTLVFYYRSRHHFSEVEVRVATALSNLAASAISTAELYEELKANDRRKDEFLAMLGHELRNPLAAVNNAVAVLKMSPDAEGKGWASDVVERQVRQLARLVEDLLDVSRITSGKVRLRRELVDAGPVLDHAAETARPLIDERKHELTVSIDRGNLPLWADTTRLEQIVVNLLTNAAKYTESGGHIWLTAGREGDDAVIRVRDTGVGIAPENLPGMFQLFAQGERSIARSEGGLGLGLTIVQKLAEMHGGGVSASSPGLGEGSEFAVRLPLARRSRPRAADAHAPAKAVERRSRVLVVDDNVDTARGMARLLKLLGNDVAVAHDGPTAVETARAFRPEFVLLDIGLPGMDGYQVAAVLRQDDALKGTVIIGVSGYGQEEDRRRSRAAGFNHHLVKPIDFDKLVSLLATPGA